MLMRAVFDDNTFIEGDRTFRRRLRESKGTHHLIVRHTNCEGYLVKVGDEVAIPIEKPKYWVIVKEK